MTNKDGQTGARVAQNQVRQSNLPYMEWRTGALAQSSARDAHSAAEPLHVRQEQARAKQRNPRKETVGASLPERRRKLMEDLAAANGEVEARKSVAQPLIAVFDAIDQQLREWSLERRNGRIFTDEFWMDALDKRMDAGHAAHPFRTKLKEAERWREAVLKELKAVNEELGQ